MNNRMLTNGELKKVVITRSLATFFFLSVTFFLLAGTFNYWEAWVYLFFLFTPMSFVMVYLYKNSPDLLERRMRMREREDTQRSIIKISTFVFLLVYILPGIDKRFGWSQVPAGIVIAADVLVLTGYGIVISVFRANRYASRTVEVDQEQEVISTGPYSVVRHPMYAGVLVMYTFSPIALGSYWAAIPIVAIFFILVARIRNEEIVLRRDLKGYGDYQKRTRYRLIPGVW